MDSSTTIKSAYSNHGAHECLDAWLFALKYDGALQTCSLLFVTIIAFQGSFKGSWKGSWKYNVLGVTEIHYRWIILMFINPSSTLHQSTNPKPTQRNVWHLNFTETARNIFYKMHGVEGPNIHSRLSFRCSLYDWVHAQSITAVQFSLQLLPLNLSI